MTGTDLRERLWDVWLTLQRERVRQGGARPTQAWLAREMTARGVPITQGAISSWFSGGSAPGELNTYVVLAQVLSWGERGTGGCVDPGWLAFGDECSAPPPDFHGGAQWTPMPRNGD